MIKTALKQIAPTFFSILPFVFFLSWVGVNGEFYEDGVYLYYMQSILQDFDFNIINQVPPEFNEIVTQNFAHPSHHSVIQVPAILIMAVIDWPLTKVFGTGALGEYQLAGVLLSFFSLLVGFIYTKKAAEKIDVDLNELHFIFLFFTTALFYFSFFYLSVMEVFTFALSAFALNGLTSLYKRIDRTDGFSFGAVCAMLVTNKMTFFPLFAVAVYYAIKNYKKDLKFLVLFLVSSIMIFLVAILKDFASFGGIVSISKAMTQFASDYSLINLLSTIGLGIFGKGGLLYTNPAYFIGFAGFTWLSLRQIALDKRSCPFWCALLMWLGMSFFQTIFIAGPMLEDHYVGRLMLLSLPLMLIGVAYLDKKIFLCNKRPEKVLFFCVLLAWQAFTLINYLTISAKGHYQYALKKIVWNFDEVFNHMAILWSSNNQLVKDEFAVFIAFVLLTGLVLSVLLKNRNNMTSYMNFYFKYACFVLVLFSIFNLINSKRNGRNFLVNNKMMSNVTMANHYSVYSFNYIVDILRTQSYNSKNPELKEIIKRKHLNYLDEVRPHIIQASPKFKKALMEKDLEYGYYNQSY